MTELQCAVYCHGRDFGIDYFTIGMTYESCVREATSVEDKYAPAEIVFVEITSRSVVPDPTMYYRGEAHTFQKAIEDGMILND